MTPPREGPQPHYPASIVDNLFVMLSRLVSLLVIVLASSLLLVGSRGPPTFLLRHFLVLSCIVLGHLVLAFLRTVISLWEAWMTIGTIISPTSISTILLLLLVAQLFGMDIMDIPRTGCSLLVVVPPMVVYFGMLSILLAPSLLVVLSVMDPTC